MFSIKTLLIVAAIIYYLYSGMKSKEAQSKKKTPSNPTPSQKSTLDELLEKMMEQQNKGFQELPKSLPPEEKKGPQKIFKHEKSKTVSKSQGMPFEKRKLSEPREMPSRKQIERVIIREKKATEQPVIKVKDYDENMIIHDLPHPTHHLSEQSKIKFHFKEEEQESFEFDARQAIISQIILERREL